MNSTMHYSVNCFSIISYGGYGYDYSHGDNRAREVFVNSVNAGRQLAVNAKARAFGASDGTAYYNGVPGGFNSFVFF